MKKNPIGFFNLNETKSKANAETEAKDEKENQTKIPPHVINEIEEHVLAKQEYEKSMNKLYKFQYFFRIGLIILAVVVAGLIFYSGYKTGQRDAIEKMEEMKAAYHKGFMDAKYKEISEKH